MVERKVTLKVASRVCFAHSLENGLRPTNRGNGLLEQLKGILRFQAKSHGVLSTGRVRFRPLPNGRFRNRTHDRAQVSPDTTAIWDC